MTRRCVHLIQLPTMAFSFLPLFFSTALQAQSDVDYAKVISSTPIYQTFESRTPERQCRIEQVRIESPSREHRSRTPSLVGAVVGGALGHAVGHGGDNQKIGTAVGAVLGASIGDDLSRRRTHVSQDEVRYLEEERCEIHDRIETREEIVGYDVRYQYNGVTYSTRMNQEPGDHIRVSVRVTPLQN